VDLEAQSVTVPAPVPGSATAPGSHSTAVPGSVVAPGAGTQFHFEIDAYRKRCLLSGLDELGYTLTQLEKIEAFERGYR